MSLIKADGLELEVCVTEVLVESNFQFGLELEPSFANIILCQLDKSIAKYFQQNSPRKVLPLQK
jgi:hypothetical protein